MSLSKQFIVTLALALVAQLSLAQSSVWKVSKGGHELYLGGTIHLLKSTDLPLPAEYDKAYKQSQTLVFETDIEGAQTPAFQTMMLQQMMLPTGQTLSSVLSKEAYEKLSAYAQSRGINLQPYEMFKPQMAGLVLTINEYQRLGFTAEGVDAIYAAKAKQDGKAVGQLETLEEQLKFISTAGEGFENEMILQSIKDMEQLPSQISDMMDAWRTGNTQKMYQVGILPMVKDYPSVYDSLLVQRNNNWMPQIEAMLKDKDVEFVLVGALHLAGDDGLLTQLKNKGYKVTLVK